MMPSEVGRADRKALKGLGDSAHVVGCCTVSCHADVTSSPWEEILGNGGVSMESNVSLGSPSGLTVIHGTAETTREAAH